MKWIYGCFITFFVVFGGTGGVPEAKSENSTGLPAIFTGNVIKTSKEGVVILTRINKFFDTDSSEGIPQKSKKGNKKGVKPQLSAVMDENSWIGDIIHDEIILINQVYHPLYPFTDNRKRGPPNYHLQNF
jgi:hypothetical protein